MYAACGKPWRLLHGGVHAFSTSARLTAAQQLARCREDRRCRRAKSVARCEVIAFREVDERGPARQRPVLGNELRLAMKRARFKRADRAYERRVVVQFLMYG